MTRFGGTVESEPDHVIGDLPRETRVYTGMVTQSCIEGVTVQ